MSLIIWMWLRMLFFSFYHRRGGIHPPSDGWKDLKMLYRGAMKATMIMRLGYKWIGMYYVALGVDQILNATFQDSGIDQI